QADTTRGREALQDLDFHVHCNQFMTPTAELADIVLPANTPWEREALRLGFEINAQAQELIQLRQRMVPPIGHGRSDMQIVFDLATRLGLGVEFFGGSIDAAWEWVLEPLPFGLADLRAHPEGLRVPLQQRYATYAEQTENGVRGFETPTRRIELYSERLLRHGYEPLPSHVEPVESPEPGSDLPYVLTSTKSAKYCHSQQRGVASLRARAPEPSVDISPQLAQDKGIANGDWVHLRTRRGRIRMRARLDDSLHPRVVVSEYGWWEAAPDLGLRGYDPFGDSGSNYNRLVDGVNVDPVSGSVPMRATVCDIARAMQSHWVGEKQFRVTRVERESPDAATLQLVPTDGLALPASAPGQHVEVTARRLTTSQESGTRSYSLSGAVDTSTPDALRITVKRKGVVSRHLVDGTAVGDVVDLTAPTGRFRLPTEPDLPVVLIAGGVGITPFMGYLEHMARHRPDTETHLFYSSRNGEHHIFGARLRELAAAMPGLRVRTYFTRPTADDLRGIDFDEQGRITADGVAAGLLQHRARFYLCGPDAMITDVRAGLIERGVPAYEVFSERFTTPTPTWRPDPSARHRVTFARSGREVDWQSSSGTLLDLAEREGVAISAGCRSGECETCVVPVASGSVGYLVSEADPDDDSRCLTCQAVPASDLTLDA
ncbi:MAG: 2Fe-2S iron-sulfur cluster-binding protein, partial [Actinomycetia bacterium]|nr:2Fe-2S iron-sulfur cluster-binding protein [Actinomycetes bacterium]